MNKIINQINNKLNKLNIAFKIVFLFIPIIFCVFIFNKLYIKNNVLSSKSKELLFLEGEYNSIVKNNSFVIELEESNKKLKSINEEIEAKNNILYDNFKKYQWNNIDSIVSDNFINSKIYMKNNNEILLYGNENFLDILYKVSDFEVKYPKYNFDFFKYDGYDKSYKFKIVNIEKE